MQWRLSCCNAPHAKLMSAPFGFASFMVSRRWPHMFENVFSFHNILRKFGSPFTVHVQKCFHFAAPCLRSCAFIIAQHIANSRMRFISSLRFAGAGVCSSPFLRRAPQCSKDSPFLAPMENSTSPGVLYLKVCGGRRCLSSCPLVATHASASPFGAAARLFAF